ncbi:MAG: hypothetical protein FWG07_10910 [Treponema sp.]|nr:hypothetical protein [Treponema sp.]
MINGFFIGFAVAILLWFLAFLYLKAFVRNRTSPDYILNELQKEVDLLAADIDEKTDQSLQLLEEKINSLREICNEAERRIAVYNRELDNRNNESLTLAVLNKKPLVERLEVQVPKGSGVSAGSTAKTAEAAYRIETRKPHRRRPSLEPDTAVPAQSYATEPTPPVQATAEQIPVTLSGQEQALPPNITKSREPLAFKPRHVNERIAELQKAGFAPDIIAKKLGISFSEVQLYFNFIGKSE